MGDLWNALIFDPMLNSLIILYTFLGNNFGLTIIVFTLIAGVVLIQLVSKEQPNTLDNQKESNIIHIR